MALHILKLAVGCESVKELKGRVAERMAIAKQKGLPLRHVHVTRMTPKRDAEILAGGSLLVAAMALAWPRSGASVDVARILLGLAAALFGTLGRS